MGDVWDPFSDPSEASSRHGYPVQAVAKEASQKGLHEDKKADLISEIQKLKVAKQKAVEEEEFEDAAVLKRRIKVLEDTLGEAVKYDEALVVAQDKVVREELEATATVERSAKPLSQIEHGEALWQLPSENLRLTPEERAFQTRSKLALRQKGVTDDTVQGVPQWAYKDLLNQGPYGVRTERPAELAYVFAGQIEDEKWEEGANFQTSIVTEEPIEAVFEYVATFRVGSTDEHSHRIQVSPGAFISHHVSGTATLVELLGSEVIEHELISFNVTVTKPKVAGKVKLEAAKTIQKKDDFKQKPFYSFKSLWMLQSTPDLRTRVTRVVKDFKQFELLEFDALTAVCRSIELEIETLRNAWSTTLATRPRQDQLKIGSPDGPNLSIQGMHAALSSEMYSASFIVEADAGQVFAALTSYKFFLEYTNLMCEASFLRLDETRVLLRQTNGVVLLVTSRVKADQMSWTTMTEGHVAGKAFKEAEAITSVAQVQQKPFYRVITGWHFSNAGEKGTLVKRTMRDFKQLGQSEISDLPIFLAEAADRENKKIAEVFQNIAAEEQQKPPKGISAVTTRANYAMRQMPEILDHAAKNNVLEVREMLEVRGADPNYIHVRKDSWSISDSRIEFYEEITPLVVAAEHGACDVIKVLFNHPQIDVNLCCCAFNDSEIYNYYTAYDMTMSRKHPHAAALLRARGVLPASSEHVFKPPFDGINGRPLRETVNQMYDHDDFGYGEMPSWEVVSQGDPELAEELSKVADMLSTTKTQSEKNRTRIFKALLSDWHPDRHAKMGSGNARTATKVFQWLQAVKSWYLEEELDFPTASEQQPLPPGDDEAPWDRPTEAMQYMHPSGSLFSVW